MIVLLLFLTSVFTGKPEILASKASRNYSYGDSYVGEAIATTLPFLNTGTGYVNLFGNNNNNNNSARVVLSSPMIKLGKNSTERVAIVRSKILC